MEKTVVDVLAGITPLDHFPFLESGSGSNVRDALEAYGEHGIKGALEIAVRCGCISKRTAEFLEEAAYAGPDVEDRIMSALGC